MSNIAVFAIYPSRGALERGLIALRDAGFRHTDVSVLYAENLGNRDLAHERSSKASEGAAAGSTAGLTAGAAFGWLVGAGALTLPGLGAFIAAGPVMGALAGAGAGGAIGTITGALVGLGVPEYEAKRYEGRVSRGGILVSVHADDAARAQRGAQILEATGAVDVGITDEAIAGDRASERSLPRAGAIDGGRYKGGG